MNGVINIQKVFSPISSARRVGRQKKQYSDSQEKRFERHLEEEKDGESNEKQAAPASEMKDRNDEKGKEEERNFKNESAVPGTDKNGESSQDRVGTLVDIRV